MSSRRSFLKSSAFISTGALLGSWASGPQEKIQKPLEKNQSKSFFISTWEHGLDANAEAVRVLAAGGSVLDAVEKGVGVSESDPLISTVGYGGSPDRDGFVTLDACIMDSKGNAGSVCFIEGFEHPISIARKVMEVTPHVILAGDGAAQFAREQGFPEKDMLTPQAKKDWEEWNKESKYKPVINIENHDTIGMLGFHQGEIVGACTTSGMAYKMHGRVGDSPIIGAGLYIDGEVGGCTCSGLGEYVLKSLTSFLVVEFMRQGMTPSASCKMALERIKTKYLDTTPGLEFQVALIAVNINGELAGYSIYPGFNYAVAQNGMNVLVDAPYLIWKDKND